MFVTLLQMRVDRFEKLAEDDSRMIVYQVGPYFADFVS